MRPRVLIIDDEIHVADTLAIILSEYGFEASAEYSGAEGVRNAIQFRPDVVISDVIMPGMSGVKTALQIQERLPQCRVLLLSGVPEVARHEMRGLACESRFELLAKPISPVVLLSCLNSAGSGPA